MQEPSCPTSSSLLERAKSQDQAAWERLVGLYEPLIRLWVSRAGLQSSDVGDLVQNVFESVAGALDRFQKHGPGSSFRGWLWTITRNKLHDYYRERQSLPKAFGGSDACRQLHDVPAEEPDLSDAETEIVARQVYRRVLEYVRSEFREHTWQMFWQAVIRGRPVAEIAEDLGVSPAAVRMAKSRVLKRLREEMETLEV